MNKETNETLLSTIASGLLMASAQTLKDITIQTPQDKNMELESHTLTRNMCTMC